MRRQLKITREGKLLILITLGVGFAAINTGNNLLYLVLGMLLAMIVVSGVLSELTLRGIEVNRRYVDSTHAGTEALLALEICNTKRRLNSYSVEVEEVFEDDENVSQKPAYALKVAPGESKTVAIRVQFNSRGVHRSVGLKIATRYPFSFFRKWRYVAAPLEIVVYPQIWPVSAPWLDPGATDGVIHRQRKVGLGAEYHGLREYQRGDDPRSIHWKTSARRQRLMSREFEAPGEKRLWLVLPNAVVGEADPQCAETGISEAASLAIHYQSVGWAVGIQSLDGLVPPSTGPGHMKNLMTHLAVVPVHADDQVPQRLARSADERQRGLRLLVRHVEQRSLGVGGEYDSIHEVSRVV